MFLYLFLVTMNFNKESNLSARSKRRRVQEELQNSRNYAHSFNKSQTTLINDEHSQPSVDICTNMPVSQPVFNEIINESLESIKILKKIKIKITF